MAFMSPRYVLVDPELLSYHTGFAKQGLDPPGTMQKLSEAGKQLQNESREDPGKPAQSFDPETPSLSGSGIPHLSGC
ncbi:hypothetical protein PHLCEN_2v7675 [Hermanssonia centrifuga]|uniref:Uncharacterized protein n=1 Tax=Hermanssonia centrifuga TaxID=98765 RepID=A0A2R6NVV7_9APHY|nr:hypothetical protein PHLCEN_2v7675 [Hermanssonia centrifuga]